MPDSGYYELKNKNMKFSKWLVMITTVVFAASCGENSTNDKSGTDTTAGTTTLSAPDPANTDVQTGTVNVPEPVKTSFQQRYPNVSNATWNRYEPVDRIDWEWSGWPAMDTSDYVATWNQDGSDYWSWYDENNNWIGTVTTVKDHASLPAAVNKVVQKEFDGYTITSVDKENDKNQTAYEIKMSKGDDRMKALITESGKVLKKKGMVAGEKTKQKVDY
jgi:hypothetical protein